MAWIVIKQGLIESRFILVQPHSKHNDKILLNHKRTSMDCILKLHDVVTIVTLSMESQMTEVLLINHIENTKIVLPFPKYGEIGHLFGQSRSLNKLIDFKFCASKQIDGVTSLIECTLATIVDGPGFVIEIAAEDQ